MPLDPEAHAREGCLLLITAARLIQRRLDQALAPLSLTHAAVITLNAASSRPLNQEQLAAIIHVQSQTLGGVLARLETRDLVTRTRHPHDRRQFQVHITPAGQAALTAARQAERTALPTDFPGWEILQDQLTRFVKSCQNPRPAPDPTLS